MSLIKKVGGLGAILALTFLAACSSPLNLETSGPAQDLEARGTAAFQKTYNNVYFRGTTNTWGTTAMTLVDNYTWEIVVAFGYSGTERFKFDVNGDWSLNFGDNNNDGVADQNGADIAVANGSRTIIRFNDQTKAYKVYPNIDFDCYAMPDRQTVIRDIDVAGLTVTLYDANNKVVRTSTVNYTTSHGTYAPFRNPGVLPGTYTAKINEIRVTPTQSYRYFAETTFTMSSTASPSPNLTVACEEWEADFDVYAMAQNNSFNDSELSGMGIELWDTLGNFAKKATIVATATHGVYASFRDLRVVPGTYTAKVDETKDGYHYTGSFTFTVGRTGPSPIMYIKKEFVGGNAEVYFNLVGAHGQEGTILNGLTCTLSKDGKVVLTKIITGEDYQQPWAPFTGLALGTYTISVDQVLNNVRYQGSSTFTIIESPNTVWGSVWVTGTPTYAKTFDKVYFRGTWNNWGVTEMALVGNYTWRIVLKFGSTSSERFKFDIKGDWTLNYGDNNKDFTADQNGADIAVAANTTYEILFNDQTKKYTLTVQ